MTSLKNPQLLLIVAALFGLVLGSAASVAIAGESAYGGSWWSQFSGSLVLSPVLMTLGMLVSLGAMGIGFFFMLFLGAVLAFVSLFMGIRRCFPRPQWMMFVGTFLWSLGNASAMETMMGV